MHRPPILFLAMISACMVGESGYLEVEGDHAADYVGAEMSCPTLGVSSVRAIGDDGNVPDNVLAVLFRDSMQHAKRYQYIGLQN